MNDTLNIKVTKIARKTCRGYGSATDCLLATALKRQFPKLANTVWVGGYTFTLGGITYDMPEEISDRIVESVFDQTPQTFQPFSFVATKAKNQKIPSYLR